MKNLLKFFFIGGLSLLAITLAQDIFTQAKKFEEISKIESQANSLEKQNKDLQENSQSAKSTFAMEKLARDKLGYQKPGETLYVSDLNDEEKKGSEQEKENWRTWWELFLN